MALVEVLVKETCGVKDGEVGSNRDTREIITENSTSSVNMTHMEEMRQSGSEWREEQRL